MFRSRNYLPHLESLSGNYFVTYRLAGSIPPKVYSNWKLEREEIKRNAIEQKRSLSNYENERLRYLFNLTEKYLDQSFGDCWLKNPSIAQVVVDAFLYFNGQRYQLHTWCVMPNHIHVVFTVLNTENESESHLKPILHAWKSFTAHRANKILNRTGKFWQDEYYDHLIRCDEDFVHCVEYTLNNPVQAKLCRNWWDWPWTGCSNPIQRLLQRNNAGGTPAPL